MIHQHAANPFTGSPLDRLDHRRRDAGWVRGRLDHPDTRFAPVWRGRNLVGGPPEAPRAAYLGRAEIGALLPAAPWAMLGAADGACVFALDLSRLDAPLAHLPGVRFDDLRRMAMLLPGDEASVLAHARGLMHWRTRAGFCGVCGAVCTPDHAGNVMVCGGCGVHHFPRTDPAVIMLVTHGERALLGQPARFRDMRVFTTLAGFVEPGESLEETVVREVWEEAGVRVGDVRYHSSQPWPFPASIMLGFTAQASSETITHDPHELVEARWFTREEARAADGFVLPPKMSIARRLINDWLSEQ